MNPNKSESGFSAFSTLIIFFVLCLIGVATIPFLSVQLVPSRTLSSVSIYSSLPGASQEVVELELTNPIENVLAGLKGIKAISSNTESGSTRVHVELDKWTDPELFRFEVSSQLRQLQNQLPDNSSYPQVYLNRPDDNRYKSSMLGYSLNGPVETNELALIAEERIRPLLARINGVFEVNIAGVKSERIVIQTDKAKMQSAQMGHQELVSILGEGLANRNIGMVNANDQRVEVVMEGSLFKFDQLENFPLKNLGGRIVRLKDVASIEKNFQPDRTYYRINGQDLINISIYPEEHVNTVSLAKEVKEVMDLVKEELPAGYKLTMNYDSTEYIKKELEKIYIRTLLSVFILLSFVLLITRQLRYMFIVVASLAVNVLLSFIFYYIFKLEIHLYSLAGITISVGLIIDNIIVIVEDIRHTGKNRIFAAILASTFTALGALSVIFLLEESQRLNLLDFAIAIIINLIVSLPVAYFFIPALLEKFPVQIKKSAVLFKRKRRLVGFSRFYFKQAHFMLRKKWIFVLLLILCFGLPTYLLPEKSEKENTWGKAYNHIFGSEFYNKNLREPINKYLGGVSYLYISSMGGFRGANNSGDEERTQLFVRISMPNGSTLAQMDEVTRGFEDYLKQFDKELEVFTANVSGPNSAMIDILFTKEYRDAFPHRLKALLETESIMSGSADFQVYGVGRGFSNAINVDNYDSTIALKGYNYSQLQDLALKVRDTLLQNPRVADVSISSQDRYEGKPIQQYQISLTDPEYLTVYQIGRRNMSSSINSFEEQQSSVGTIPVNNEYMQLAVLTNYEDPPNIWSTLQTPLPVKESVMLKLADLSEISKVKLSSSIKRHNQEYLLNVHYRFIGTWYLNDLVKKRVVKSLNEQIPFGYEVFLPDEMGWWGGNTSGSENLWYVALVLLIIFMICAVLLESFSQSFAVILMIPFSFIGVFLIFYLLELKFDQGGYAALLMLSGLVTNVALYIINDINFINKHYPKKDAKDRVKIYIKAFNAKAMPIMITTGSAILSLLPFTINGEEQGFWFTLSAGTIGGLLFSLFGAYLMLPLALLKTEKKFKINKRYGKISG